MNRHRLMLGIVVLAAAGFRLAVIDRPFEYDAEGSSCLYGVLARNYLRVDWARTHGMPVLTVGNAPDGSIVFYRDHPPLVPLLIVPFYALFGVGEWQTRLPFALVTLAAIVAIYRLMGRAESPRVGLLAAALFAATPMTLYFGGFPDVIGTPLLLAVLAAVSAYMPFHRRPAMATLVPFVAAFALAGICDWEAYIIVPVFLAHFAATKPWREWPWIIGFCTAACAVFAAVYVYIAVSTDAPWDWMAPLFSRRSAITGGKAFTLTEWFAAAFGFNRVYHTLPLLAASALWIALAGFRFRRSAPGATVARLLFAWGALYVVIGSKAVFDHEWPWMLLTPGIVIATALLIESLLEAARKRGFEAAAERLAAIGIVLFAVWIGFTTFRLLRPVAPFRSTTPMELGRAIQAAAPSPDDVVLIVGGEEMEPQLWFYGDRAIRTRAWSIPDFERRVEDTTVDVMYDFEVQPWRARATGVVLPRQWDNGAGQLRMYLTARYSTTSLSPDLAGKFDVFDLRRR